MHHGALVCWEKWNPQQPSPKFLSRITLNRFKYCSVRANVYSSQASINEYHIMSNQALPIPALKKASATWCVVERRHPVSGSDQNLFTLEYIAWLPLEEKKSQKDWSHSASSCIAPSTPWLSNLLIQAGIQSLTVLHHNFHCIRFLYYSITNSIVCLLQTQ